MKCKLILRAGKRQRKPSTIDISLQIDEAEQIYEFGPNPNWERGSAMDVLWTKIEEQLAVYDNNVSDRTKAKDSGIPL